MLFKRKVLVAVMVASLVAVISVAVMLGVTVWQSDGDRAAHKGVSDAEVTDVDSVLEGLVIHVDINSVSEGQVIYSMEPLPNGDCPADPAEKIVGTLSPGEGGVGITMSTNDDCEMVVDEIGSAYFPEDADPSSRILRQSGGDSAAQKGGSDAEMIYVYIDSVPEGLVVHVDINSVSEGQVIYSMEPLPNGDCPAMTPAEKTVGTLSPGESGIGIIMSMNDDCEMVVDEVGSAYFPEGKDRLSHLLKP